MSNTEKQYYLIIREDQKDRALMLEAFCISKNSDPSILRRKISTLCFKQSYQSKYSDIAKDCIIAEE